MRLLMSTFVTFVAVVACGVSSPHAATWNVTTAANLQTALTGAVAGDEIVLANGTYSGQFTIGGNNGTAGQPITMRAANRHQAILEAPTAACSWSASESALQITRAYWIIQDLKIRNTVFGIYACGPRQCSGGAHHLTLQDLIIDDYRGMGIQLTNGADNSLVQRNVIGYSNPACAGTPNTIGIENWYSANNTFRDNIILPSGSNGYACASGGCDNSRGGEMGGDLGWSGYGMAHDDDETGGGATNHDNLIQGNLIIEGGRGVFRIINGAHNTVRDNTFLWGKGGGYTTDHCSDDYNTFINNIGYGNYFLGFSTKGNDTGSRGNHVWQHNLTVMTAFAHDGGGFGTGSGPLPCHSGYKVNMTLVDNLIMADIPLLNESLKLFILTTQATQAAQLAVGNRNLFWAPSAESTWVINYTFGANDIHAQASQPQFVNAAQGDFTLAAGSPGKGAASDGKDIGIEYNQYLKKSWLAQAFALPTQQNNNLTTSTSFTVDPTHYYQVWFYIPTSFFAGFETFTVEGAALGRDINGLSNATGGTRWIQTSGPQRWITLGRHKAADGVLNISWTNAGSASQIFIRQIPTADEAYQWIVAPATTPNPPQNLRVQP